MIAADVDDRFNKWLGFFNVAVAAKDIDALLILFHPDAFWRDMLAFTWNVRTVEGHGEIRQMLDACLARTAPTAWRPMRPARLEDGIVEGIVEFETNVARCKAVIRLRDGKAWTLLTSTAELKGFEASPGPDHVGDSGSAHQERPHSDAASATSQPYCVIVGAGHCGLALGVQLRNLGVPTLIIDRRERPSDTWRNRHDSLTLHSPSYFDQMPGFSYPDNWPVYPSKERFADWLDAYQSMMQLDVMTGAECVGAKYDDARGKWRLKVKRRDRAIELNPEQLVLATGLTATPKIPDIPGKERFKGPQQYASLYRSNPLHRDCRCVVVGSGTTAHDIAADLLADGADVTMIQRSPTIVMKLETLLEGFASLYGSEPKAQGITIDLADLLFAATPLRILVGMHQKLVKHVREKDAAFYRRLESAGFRLTFGEDEGGVFPQILRDPGGYYIDVGASELIANGSIKLRCRHHGASRRKRCSQRRERTSRRHHLLRNRLRTPLVRLHPDARDCKKGRPAVGVRLRHPPRSWPLGGGTAEYVEAHATERVVVSQCRSWSGAVLLARPRAADQGPAVRDSDARVRRRRRSCQGVRGCVNRSNHSRRITSARSGLAR
ncbi:NAD(P)/FAD-dependent oxidoreductase [Bradyrhizobium sp. Ai1a-2]|uniref:NAD(P)/FAD-dependent oxidoreductase n=1 Tax=Bradyrhizobium sp. Ai1a-2 TaxID=196490 RepID=UPI0004113035|nr:NAD(P)/FAD-dependent oxidoreductase [Bradyrhizobium sp. Ai1a-2]